MSLLMLLAACDRFQWADDCEDFVRAPDGEAGWVRVTGELDGVPFELDSVGYGGQGGCVEPTYGLTAIEAEADPSRIDVMFVLETDGSGRWPEVILVTRDATFTNRWTGDPERIELQGRRPSEWAVKGKFEGVVSDDGVREVPISGTFAAETAYPK